MYYDDPIELGPWWKAVFILTTILLFVAQVAHVEKWRTTIMDPAGQLIAALEAAILICAFIGYHRGH